MSEKKILIAEDEKPMARAMKLKLENEGYIADIANNGNEAVEGLKKGYDLLLLDLMMPELDGFGVLEARKKNNIKTPVIVSSNLSQQEDFARAKELGAVDYFVKSDTPLTEVIERVKKALG